MKSEFVLFSLALGVFIYGLNRIMVRNKEADPQRIQELIQTLKNNNDSEFKMALQRVTSKAKEENIDLSKLDMFSGKMSHIDFLIQKSEYKKKACDFMESEFQTFDYNNRSPEALRYLDKLFSSYFQIQTDSEKALAEVVNLQNHNMDLDFLKAIESKLIQSYPSQREQLLEKLNQK